MSDRPRSHYALRPLEKADLTLISRWFRNVDDLAAFDRTCRMPLNLAGTERSWERVVEGATDCERCWFAIESETEVVVGIVGLEAISPTNRDGVIATFLDSSLRGQGVGTRAAALMLDLAFRQLGLNRITSYYREDNNTSNQVLGQLGFQIEGRMRKAWFAQGKFFDMMVVGLLSDEWEARRTSLSSELGAETSVGMGEAGSSGWNWPLIDPNVK
ncbi:GNAT family N-acetyltransferase [Ruegeria hyattellae]|uniref:GNAT family N-acetyltransferase n=1 Tax=Ruegeria hyattellae TaxID=3233337 RepID=UPI00355C82DE